MTEKERLIELLDDIGVTCDIEEGIDRFTGGRIIDIKGADYVADHLLANGVTIAKDTDVPSKWISVEERLPDEREVVMCWHKAYVHPIFCKWDESNLCWDNDCWTFGRGLITHWMPLPQPPGECPV